LYFPKFNTGVFRRMSTASPRAALTGNDLLLPQSALMDVFIDSSIHRLLLQGAVPIPTAGRLRRLARF